MIKFGVICTVVLMTSSCVFAEFTPFALYLQKKCVEDINAGISTFDQVAKADLDIILKAYNGGVVSTEDLDSIFRESKINPRFRMLALEMYAKQREFNISIIKGLINEGGQEYVAGLFLLAAQLPTADGYSILSSQLNADVMSKRANYFSALPVAHLTSTYLFSANPYQKEVCSMLNDYQWSDGFRSFLFESLCAQSKVITTEQLLVFEMQKKCILEETNSQRLGSMILKFEGNAKVTALQAKVEQLESCMLEIPERSQGK